MSFSHWAVLALSASLPLLATARHVAPQPDPGDANAAVPAPAYASAFDGYRGQGDEQETPDQAWRSANDTVARLNGHAGHIDGDSAAAGTMQDAQASHGHHRMPARRNGSRQ